MADTSSKSSTGAKGTATPTSQPPPTKGGEGQFGGKGNATGIIGNQGTGFGAGGKVTFDPQGNRLVGGEIQTGKGGTPIFSTVQNANTYYGERGVGNTGVIVDQAKFLSSDLPQAKAEASMFTNPPTETKNREDVFFKESVKAVKGESKPKLQAFEKESYFAPKPSVDSGVGVVTPQSKEAGSKYGWQSMGAKSGVVFFNRGSEQEQKAKQTEQSRAASLFTSEAKPEPKPDITFGGHVTPESKGKSVGTGGSNVRGSAAEQALISSEASRAGKNYNAKQEENSAFFSPNFTPSKAKESNVFVEPKPSSSKDTGTLGQTSTHWDVNFFEDVGLNEGIGANGVRSSVKGGKSFSVAASDVSNQQQNALSDKEFRSLIVEGAKQDAVFVFVSDNKEVGRSSGKRALHDFLETQQTYGDTLGLVITYPTKERELTKAIQKNPEAFANLPQNYWSNISKSGYLSKNNVGKVNEILATNYEVKNRESLSLMQGSLFSELHGGPIPVGGTREKLALMEGTLYAEKHGGTTYYGGKTAIIPPMESEVSSFIKTPFVGEKSRTSLIPSTSYADVMQYWFKPYDLIAIGAVKTAEKIEPGLIGLKNALSNKVRTTIGNQARSAAIEYAGRGSTFDRRTPREVTLRPTNLRELEPVGLQIEKQTVGRRPETELERTLRLTPRAKENPNYEPNRNIWNPTPNSKFDINFKTETPVFRAGERTSNLPSPSEKKIQERYPLATSFGKVQEPLLGGFRPIPETGKAPIQKPTALTSETSPISRDFLGVQFKGTYPNTYLPPASGFASTTERTYPSGFIDVYHATDIKSANDIIKNGVDFSKTTRLNFFEKTFGRKGEFYAANSERLASFFGGREATVKMKVDTSKLLNVDWSNPNLSDEFLKQQTKKARKYSGINAKEENPEGGTWQEIILFNKNAFVGKPMLLEDLLRLNETPPELKSPTGMRGTPAVKISNISNKNDIVQIPRSQRVENRVFYELYNSKGKSLSLSTALKEKNTLGALQPIEKPTKQEQILPENTNILGRRGKPPVQRSYEKTSPVDFIQTPRSEYVSKRAFSADEFLNVSGKRGSASADIFGALGKTSRKTIEIIPPEETNILGYRGKPPIKNKSTESIMSRATVVEQTRPSYFNEVFSSSGKNLSPSLVFGETKSVGALSKASKSKKEASIINPEPQKDYQQWRFSQWESKHPTPEPVGSSRFDLFLKKLPSRNTKSAIISTGFPKEKEIKMTFLSETKGPLSSIKKVEPKKGVEFRNVGSKSQTVLLQKPLVRRKIITTGEQQYDYGYEYRPIPTTKSSSGLLSNQSLGLLTGFSLKSGSKQGTASILASLIKSTQKPKTGFDLISGLGTLLTPKQTQRQTPDVLSRLMQTPKQTTKQGTRQSVKTVPPLIPRTRQQQSPNFKYQYRLTTITTVPTPPKRPPPTTWFGSFPKSGKTKTREGPTALIQLDVRNVFSSSLDIKTPKNQRVLF